MKKFLGMVLSLTLIFCLGGYSSLAETNKDIFQMSKAEFADYCDSLPQAQANYSEEEINQLLHQFATSNYAPEYEQELNRAGYYVYSRPAEDEEQIMPMSDGSAVNLSGVTIMYGSGKWALIMGGYWTNLSKISSDMSEAGPWLGFYEGATRNCGGVDAFGFVFYNQSGPMPVTVDSSGFIHNGEGTQIDLYNPSIYQSDKGIMFEYQDYIQCTKYKSPYSYDWNYMGYGFSAIVHYNSSFENFHGRARSVYCHTWKSTSISKLNFSASKSSFNLGIEFSNNESRQFTIYNGSDTVF